MSARLLRLEIDDYELIARAEVEFDPGLTVFSGETGSGKTMLLGALAFALGERTSPDAVRAGAKRARVTLELEAGAPLRERFAAEGFEIDDGEPALVARELHAGGKSAARINGRAATAAQLRALGEAVLDFVGQHEHQRLLQRGYHLDMLDRFAGPRALELRDAIAALHARAAALESDLANARASGDRALAEAEFARFALGEIDAARLEPGEDERLRERRDYLLNAEKIAQALRTARSALADGDAAAIEALGTAASALGGVARYAAEIAQLAGTLSALQSDANEAAAAVSRLAERSDFDPGELDAIVERLDLIEGLKRKYGGTIATIGEARDRFAGTLEAFEGREQRDAGTAQALAAARSELAAQAALLETERRAAARRLEAAVAGELAGLAMPAARFEVAFETLQAVGPAGSERAEFLLAPNPGDPPRPLGRIASGGELSRVLLALVVVLAGGRERTGLVFDEIDAGIGGATANAVGLRLGALARTGQVLCVTHLAQIAAWADRHYALVKRDRADATRIEVLDLREPRSVVAEIARMLSGTQRAVAVEHAETLLAGVSEAKRRG